MPGGRAEPRSLQSSREAQPVHEPEGEGRDLGHAGGERLSASPGAHDLQCDDDDAQRDQRLDRSRGRLQWPEDRERERDAVRDGERGHGRHEPARPWDDQHEAEHEEEVVDPENDVLDPEEEEHAASRTIGQELHRGLLQVFLVAGASVGVSRVSGSATPGGAGTHALPFIAAARPRSNSFCM